MRAPDCEETAVGYRCAASGANGDVAYDRQSSGECVEEAGRRTCRSSSSVSIGGSAEGRAQAEQALDEMMRSRAQD
ncbi:MAG: hypothetical protein ABIT10_02825 [Alteraurantiacibacter sp.]